MELLFTRLCSSGFWLSVDLPVEVNLPEKHVICNLSPEDAGSLSLRNVGMYRRVYTASKPRRVT